MDKSPRHEFIDRANQPFRADKIDANPDISVYARWSSRVVSEKSLSVLQRLLSRAPWHSRRHGLQKAVEAPHTASLAHCRCPESRVELEMIYDVPFCPHNWSKAAWSYRRMMEEEERERPQAGGLI